MSKTNNNSFPNTAAKYNLNILNSPLLSNLNNNHLLKSQFKIAIWNVCGMKNTATYPSKLNRICSSIELFTPSLVMFSETHLDPNHLKDHPLPRLKSVYPFFKSSSSSSSSGGVSIISKNPIIIHYIHKSGNLIHVSVLDDHQNSIPFILCYASPNERRYYYRLILKRSNVIPDSIICGDLNTDIHNDSYFKHLLLDPLCLTPNDDPSKCTPSFFPRGKGTPKR